MKRLNHLFCYILLCTSVLAKEIPLANTLSLYTNVGFGGRLALSYERRLSDNLGLEAGAGLGEDFLGWWHLKLRHIGPFIATNFYFTEPLNKHQLYLSPRIDLAFGNFYLRENQRGAVDHGATALRASAFVIYRYLFPYNISLEAGLGLDAVSMVIPFDRANDISWRSLPIPKIHFGIGYTF